MNPADVSDLRSLVEHGDGPLLSLYVPLEPAVENASQRTMVRWTSLRRDLVDLGVPDGSLDAIEAVLPDAHHDGTGIAVFADGNAIVHQEPYDGLLDGAWWQAVPVLTPLLASRRRLVPHVVVLADRTGADVTSVGLDGDDGTRRAGGDDEPLTRVHAGGWSQRRIHERAMNTWRRNADDVAGEVRTLVERHDVALIAVGGDPQAVRLIVERLPDAVRGRVYDISTTDDVEGMVAAAAYQRDDELLQQLQDGLGTGAAVSGAHDTFESLTLGRVAALLVDAVPGEPDVDRAVAEAALTSAEVHVLDAGRVPARVAALLRWADTDAGEVR
jgi:hypothetical protein